MTTGETIVTPNAIVVIGGGEPLEGAPPSWEWAEEWQNGANKDKDEFNEPNWGWDCNFKLDFDGPLMSVSSRFYPPAKHYDSGWDGSVTIYILGKEISNKLFECKTLDELHTEVERYVKDFATTLMSKISG